MNNHPWIANRPQSKTAVIETYTGLRVDVLHLRPEDVRIEDIAYSLAGLVRFNGHSTPRYTVAQHSVRVSDKLVPYGPALAMLGLLHDAAEAYIGDVSRPLKAVLPEIAVLEYEIDGVIWAAFGLDPSPVELSLVKRADNTELRNEARQFMSSGGCWWDWRDPIPQASDETIVPVDSLSAERMFLDRFRLYQDKLRRCDE